MVKGVGKIGLLTRSIIRANLSTLRTELFDLYENIDGEYKPEKMIPVVENMIKMLNSIKKLLEKEAKNG